MLYRVETLSGPRIIEAPCAGDAIAMLGSIGCRIAVRSISMRDVVDWRHYGYDSRPSEDGFYLVTVELTIHGELRYTTVARWAEDRWRVDTAPKIVAWAPLPEPSLQELK